MHITLKPLNALDAFQLTKGLYSFALVIGYVVGLPNPQFDRVILLTANTIHFGQEDWLALLSTYTAACSLPLLWKSDRFQAFISLFSMWLWLFTGAITMLSLYNPSSGLYQMMLGAVSIWALYYRGKQHPK